MDIFNQISSTNVETKLRLTSLKREYLRNICFNINSYDKKLKCIFTKKTCLNFNDFV